MNSFLLFGLTALGSVGCGLISSDVSDFPLTIKDREFSINADSWMIDGAQVDTFLATDCSSAPTVCNSAAQQACSTGCSGTCSTTTHTCELALQVGLFQKVDLMMEQSELQSIDAEKGIHVTIDGATFEVKSPNTLNVPTPPMTIFVAAASITDPSDPAAKQIGTVASIGAMQSTAAPQDIEYTATGKADLATTLTNYTTPFNLMVGATLVVKSGDPVPMGELTAIVHIKAHAGF